MQPKCYPFLGALLCVVFLSVSGNPLDVAATEQNQQEQNVKLRWALYATKQSESAPAPFLVEDDTTLKTGDHLRFFLEPLERCFVYLIHQDPNGALQLLFPSDARQMETCCRAGEKYYVPEGRRWFQLDPNIGLERFFLLASAHRLHTLEGQLSEYERAQTADRSELVNRILAEIRKTRLRHRTLKSSAERPAAIVGRVRTIQKSDKPDTQAEAIEVSAKDFYSRTLTIEHR